MCEDKKKKLHEEVSGWLEEQGCKLEYKTYNAFKSAGMNVIMNHYFESKEGINREIDVVAKVNNCGEGKDLHLVNVFCECKYSKDKAWILLSTGYTSHYVINWACVPKSPSLEALDEKIIDYRNQLLATWHFSPEHKYGFNLLQALRD
ncbi:MAG: hypothetical protein JW904_05250 [Spirochaetales bacterium]|nr:hypothetical protein [Spirochaetales bacterium]